MGRASVSEERVECRLAAILVADVADYSRLMADDEEGTLAALKAGLAQFYNYAERGMHKAVLCSRERWRLTNPMRRRPQCPAGASCSNECKAGRRFRMSRSRRDGAWQEWRSRPARKIPTLTGCAATSPHFSAAIMPLPRAPSTARCCSIPIPPTRGWQAGGHHASSTFQAQRSKR